ncbi:MAG TPA: hypothetical protein VIT44_08325 [Cyclobacteriaceae bacterium]
MASTEQIQKKIVFKAIFEDRNPDVHFTTTRGKEDKLVSYELNFKSEFINNRVTILTYYKGKCYEEIFANDITWQVFSKFVDDVMFNKNYRNDTEVSG